MKRSESQSENDTQEWDWTKESDSYGTDTTDNAGTEGNLSVATSLPCVASSVESTQSQESSDYGYQGTTMSYQSDDPSQYDTQEYYNYYHGWQETGTQPSSGQNFTPEQWFNQWYEQLYTAYQQFAVPYHHYSSEYANASYATYPPSNSSPGLQNDLNQKQSSRRRSLEKPRSLFYCESCDRSYPDQTKLEEHLAEHKTCGIDGCKFTAHEKVVDKHIEMQHDTGLYRRIISNDDTEKWRAERKK